MMGVGADCCYHVSPLQRGINPDIHTTNQLCPTSTRIHMYQCGQSIGLSGLNVLNQLVPPVNDANTCQSHTEFRGLALR